MQCAYFKEWFNYVFWMLSLYNSENIRNVYSPNILSANLFRSTTWAVKIAILSKLSRYVTPLVSWLVVHSGGRERDY
jgi:hypothetical protein